MADVTIVQEPAGAATGAPKQPISQTNPLCAACVGALGQKMPQESNTFRPVITFAPEDRNLLEMISMSLQLLVAQNSQINGLPLPSGWPEIL